MISAIRSTISALFALQKKLDSTANNVANIETDGYKKERVTMEEQKPSGVKANVEKIDTPGPQVLEQTERGEVLVEKSNVELAEEMPNLLITQRSFEANLKMLKTEDEMVGSLLDVVG